MSIETQLSIRIRSLPAPVWKRALGMWQIYVFILPALLYILIFEYGPMYGVLMAFKDYSPARGIWESDWVGLKQFIRFFNLPRCGAIIFNTFFLSLYSLAAGFPLPIILALSMNAVGNKHYKKIVQTVTYMPHFISTVVIVGIMMVFMSPTNGIVNTLIKALGGNPVFFFGEPEMFASLYVWSGVWQGMGWSSIIYLASLSAVDQTMHEAAIVDGATKFQRMLKIDLPSILPTIIILLILNCGRLMSVGFEKAYLMQTPLNTAASEVISTYVYKRGLVGGEFSFSTAVGLFNAAVNLMMLVIVNTVANRVSRVSLW